MRAIVSLAVCLTLCVSGSAFAQPDPGSGAEEEAVAPADDAAATTCSPPCRSGYVCHEGACISGCNPPCPSNELCTPNGECVSRCNPVCAANEVCTPRGACVSMCNPPCAAGQRCTPQGACMGGVAGGALLGATEPASPGWARKAGKLGIGTAVLLALAGAGIVIADDPDVGLAIGIPATLLGGIMIPVVGAGGSSARKRGSGVVGSPGLHRAGYVIYAIALTDAAVLLGFAFADDPLPAPVSASVALLGSASAICLSIDARKSASQAEALQAAGQAAIVPVVPTVSFARDADDKPTPTVGVSVRF